MSWEAQRLTSKSPSEVYAVLGPHGVADLVRQAWAACWREFPEDGRTFKAVRQRFFEVFSRNMSIWRRIKKPTPEAFFMDFKPHDTAEGHIRQTLVLSCMMMPQAGGREFKDTLKIVQRIYDRNVEEWEEDGGTSTAKPKGRAKAKTKVKRAAPNKVDNKAKNHGAKR